jgi:hypothetical protein
MKKHKMLILGRSSSGKTSSLRNLDAARTGIINCDKEELIFPHSGYVTNVLADGRPDLTTSNYVETGKPASVISVLKAWDMRPDLDVIVLDTLTHLITEYYITEALGKEFGGYKELGTSFWHIMNTIKTMDKHVIVMGHIDNKFNDMGQRELVMKSHGKMIQEFEPESYFNTLMIAQVRKVEGTLRWDFKTQPDEAVEKCKGPAKFLPDGTVVHALDQYESNDANAILQKLITFYSN